MYKCWLHKTLPHGVYFYPTFYCLNFNINVKNNNKRKTFKQNIYLITKVPSVQLWDLFIQGLFLCCLLVFRFQTLFVSIVNIVVWISMYMFYPESIIKLHWSVSSFFHNGNFNLINVLIIIKKVNIFMASFGWLR